MNIILKKIIISVFCIVFFVLPAISFAESGSLSAKQVVEKANLISYYAGKDGKAEVKMIITDKDGNERRRRFVILRADIKDGGDQYFYVYFKRPADVRKMVFMVWKHLNKDDDRWLYLPALDLVRRIAASDKRSNFVGSHFLYEDVSGRNPEDDIHEIIKEENDLYMLKNTPKDPETVEFSYFTLTIDKKTFLPMKAEYYDKGGKLYRKVESLEVKSIQGFPTVTKAKVSDMNSGGFTISEFTKVKYNIGVEQKIFSERYLRRPPRKWMK